MSNGRDCRTITVIGYASLLSERSARETIPSLSRFQLVRVPGYRRIFNKVGIVFFERFGASGNDARIASCSTQAAPGCEIVCSRFDCDEDDFLGIYEREHRFRWIGVEYFGLDGQSGTARMCTENTDENYLLNKCVTWKEYERRVGAFYKGKIWRTDILPFPTYLKHCLDAAESQGPEVLANFLDTSFLSDGVTSIGQYIIAHPDWAEGALEHYSYDD